MTLKGFGRTAHHFLCVVRPKRLPLYFPQWAEIELDGCRSTRRHGCLLLKLGDGEFRRFVIELLRRPQCEPPLQLLLREIAAAAPVKCGSGCKARHRMVAMQIWTAIAAEGEHDVGAK